MYHDTPFILLKLMVLGSSRRKQHHIRIHSQEKIFCMFQTPPLKSYQNLLVRSHFSSDYIVQSFPLLPAESLNSCPKSGLHNPFKNPERYNHPQVVVELGPSMSVHDISRTLLRYVLLGTITARAAAKMIKPSVMDFFTRLIQRVAPKSDVQARAEVGPSFFPCSLSLLLLSLLLKQLRLRSINATTAAIITITNNKNILNFII